MLRLKIELSFDQTTAMGKLNASQMNVRSLELSDTGAMVYCSSVDIRYDTK